MRHWKQSQQKKMSSFQFAYCPILLITYDFILPILGQTISNIPDLDTQLPNFYRWMEQNSYICEDSSFSDSLQFLSEEEAHQFHCSALCGDPMDIPHLACAKRSTQRPHEWPQCHPVPTLCILNFMQEFLALKIHIGEFSIDHLTSLTSHNQQKQFTQPSQITSTSSTTFDQQKLELIGKSQENNIEAGFERRKITDDFQFVQVDGETKNHQEHQRKSSEVQQSTTTLSPFIKNKYPNKEANALEFKKDSPPTLSRLIAPKKPIMEIAKKHHCLPDVDVDSCKFWAQNGQCKANPVYMLRECKWACGLCGNDGEVEELSS